MICVLPCEDAVCYELSTVVNKSLEEYGTSTTTEDNVDLSRSHVNMSTISVCSDASHSTVKANADCSSKEVGLNKKDSDKLEATESDDREVVISVEHSDVLKSSVQLSDNGSTWNTSKQTCSEASGKEIVDLRKTQLAAESSISTDSHHGSRLSVRSEASEECSEFVRDGTSADVHACEDLTTSRTSVSSRKSGAQRRKTKNKTENCEASSDAVSLVRCDESQISTKQRTAADVTASRRSLRSLKSHRKSQLDSSKALSSAASVVSLRSDEAQIITEDSAADVTASRTSLKPHAGHSSTKCRIDSSEAGSLMSSVATSRSDKLLEVSDDNSSESVPLDLSCRGNVESELSVRLSDTVASSKGFSDLEADSSTLGSRSAEVLSNSCSVITSKPPKHLAVKKTVKDERAAAEAKTSQTSCTSGDSHSLHCVYGPGNGSITATSVVVDLLGTSSWVLLLSDF